MLSTSFWLQFHFEIFFFRFIDGGNQSDHGDNGTQSDHSENDDDSRTSDIDLFVLVALAFLLWMQNEPFV